MHIKLFIVVICIIISGLVILINWRVLKRPNLVFEFDLSLDLNLLVFPIIKKNLIYIIVEINQHAIYLFESHVYIFIITIVVLVDQFDSRKSRPRINCFLERHLERHTIHIQKNARSGDSVKICCSHYYIICCKFSARFEISHKSNIWMHGWDEILPNERNASRPQWTPFMNIYLKFSLYRVYELLYYSEFPGFLLKHHLRIPRMNLRFLNLKHDEGRIK